MSQCVNESVSVTLSTSCWPNRDSQSIHTLSHTHTHAHVRARTHTPLTRYSSSRATVSLAPEKQAAHKGVACSSYNIITQSLVLLLIYLSLRLLNSKYSFLCGFVCADHCGRGCDLPSLVCICFSFIYLCVYSIIYLFLWFRLCAVP